MKVLGNIIMGMALALLVPTRVTMVSMAAFGGSALEQAQNGIGALGDGIDPVTARGEPAP